ENSRVSYAVQFSRSHAPDPKIGALFFRQLRHYIIMIFSCQLFFRRNISNSQRHRVFGEKPFTMR
ncbi:MAG TPA: hypothetical protein PLP20_02265, partial [Oscillospiraceae bacterium]|nr:hypothetical protein [Oscillospiraceae bacterium]HPV99862.1 hypothetical protein [Oscillospiraceae bacterium]